MSPPAIRGVIFDLDGTIIDTESICTCVSRAIVAKYGKKLTHDVIRVSFPMVLRVPMVSAHSVAIVLGESAPSHHADPIDTGSVNRRPQENAPWKHGRW